MYSTSEINIYGTEIQHLTAIKDYFLNSSPVGWTLVSQRMNGFNDTANEFTVGYGNIRLTVVSDNLNDTDSGYHYFINFSLANGAFAGNAANVRVMQDGSKNRTEQTQRILKVITAKQGDTLLVSISGYANTVGYIPYNPLLIKTGLGDTEVASVDAVSGGDAQIVFHKTADGTGSYIPAPYHNNVSVGDKLILDTELPVKNDSGCYMEDTLDNCYGLGGGESGKFYRGNNNELLFCFNKDCCIKL